MNNNGVELHVEVRDDGVGLPEGFNPENTDSLGTSIVSNLVTSQLNGKISMYNDNGTVVELHIPVSRLR
jgi:two-component sensor histidine kinase